VEVDHAGDDVVVPPVFTPFVQVVGVLGVVGCRAGRVRREFEGIFESFVFCEGDFGRRFVAFR